MFLFLFSEVVMRSDVKKSIRHTVNLTFLKNIEIYCKESGKYCGTTLHLLTVGIGENTEF